MVTAVEYSNAFLKTTSHNSFNRWANFLDYLQWLGTSDLAAYLPVPAAISFMEANDWNVVRGRCHELVRLAIESMPGEGSTFYFTLPGMIEI